MKPLGARLRDARIKKRLTQKEVAKKLGISNGTLSGYERNYRDPDTEILTKLAELYEESTDYLIGRVKSSILYPTERELVDSLDLSDDQIINKIPMYFEGRELTSTEKKEFIAITRALFSSRKDLIDESE